MQYNFVPYLDLSKFYDKSVRCDVLLYTLKYANHQFDLIQIKNNLSA